MPEGDTIHRSARRLEPILLNATVIAARDNGRFVDSKQLIDATFVAVTARGKHLIMRLEDGRVLHSHMGMTGSWHVYALGDAWRKSPHRAALVLTVQQRKDDKSNGGDQESPGACEVVCFSPKTLELLSSTQFRRHAFLNRLGPDLMVETYDPEIVLSRFRVHNSVSIGEAVMNQTIVCGVGNVYKSETLFLTKLNPFVRVAELSDASVLAVVEKAQSLMQKNSIGHPRQTRLSADRERYWVYGRSREPCFECGTRIEMRRQGDLGRSTYWCPRCQANL